MKKFYQLILSGKNLTKSDQSSQRICGALRDLVPFVQFEKREKHPWRSVNFSKVAGSFSLLEILSLNFCVQKTQFYM